MRKIILVFSFFVFVNIATAENWEYISSGEESGVDVDYYGGTYSKRIEKERYMQNEKRFAWVKAEYNRPVQYLPKDKRKIKTILMEVESDCSVRKIGYKSFVYYFSNGTNDANQQSFSILNSVIPDTVEEEIFKLVCK